MPDAASGEAATAGRPSADSPGAAADSSDADVRPPFSWLAAADAHPLTGAEPRASPGPTGPMGVALSVNGIATRAAAVSPTLARRESPRTARDPRIVLLTVPLAAGWRLHDRSRGIASFPRGGQRRRRTGTEDRSLQPTAVDALPTRGSCPDPVNGGIPGGRRPHDAPRASTRSPAALPVARRLRQAASVPAAGSPWTGRPCT